VDSDVMATDIFAKDHSFAQRARDYTTIWLRSHIVAPSAILFSTGVRLCMA
jgi:hypothetical protein